MLGAILFGFVAGVLARVLMPRDFFQAHERTGLVGPCPWEPVYLVPLSDT